MIAKKEDIACLLVDVLSFVRLSSRAVGAREKIRAGRISVTALRMGPSACRKFVKIVLAVRVAKVKLIGAKIIRMNSRTPNRPG